MMTLEARHCHPDPEPTDGAAREPRPTDGAFRALASVAVRRRFGERASLELSGSGALVVMHDLGAGVEPVQSMHMTRYQRWPRDHMCCGLMLVDSWLRSVEVTAGGDNPDGDALDAAVEAVREGDEEHWPGLTAPPVALRVADGTLHVLWDEAADAGRYTFARFRDRTEHWVRTERNPAKDSPWPDLSVRRIGSPRKKGQ